MSNAIRHDPLAIQPRTALPVEKHSTAARKLHSQAEQAAEQFETLMALQMVRGMQSSLKGSSLFGDGVSGDVYSGLADWELARLLAKSGNLGLKEQILRQLPKEEDPGHEIRSR
jgi:Rod binding domain-containing protein